MAEYSKFTRAASNVTLPLTAKLHFMDICSFTIDLVMHVFGYELPLNRFTLLWNISLRVVYCFEYY